MKEFKGLAFLACILVIILVALAIYNNTNEFIQKQLYGQEYCFSEISQNDLGVAARGIEIKYTKTEGDELCFRTKDTSIVERLNQQIQDRKLQESLAKLQSQDRFWNQTLPIIVLIVILGIIIILIIFYLANRNNGGL